TTAECPKSMVGETAWPRRIGLIDCLWRIDPPTPDQLAASARTVRYDRRWHPVAPAGSDRSATWRVIPDWGSGVRQNSGCRRLRQEVICGALRQTDIRRTFSRGPSATFQSRVVWRLRHAYRQAKTYWAIAGEGARHSPASAVVVSELGRGACTPPRAGHRPGREIGVATEPGGGRRPRPRRASHLAGSERLYERHCESGRYRERERPD